VPKVDPRFADLIAPLSPEERQHLSEHPAEGCRDALVVWRGYLWTATTGWRSATATDSLTTPPKLRCRIGSPQSSGLRKTSLDAGTSHRSTCRSRISDHAAAGGGLEKAACGQGRFRSFRRQLGGTHAHQDEPHLASESGRRESTRSRLENFVRLLRLRRSTRTSLPGLPMRKSRSGTPKKHAGASAAAKIKAALKTHVRGEGIHTGHMRKLFRILDDDSVDLICTDPPWEHKALPLYTELGKLAQQKTEPGGFCLVLCGHSI